MAKDAAVTYIPIDGIPAHLGVIGYLAELAYPSREDWGKRDKLVDAAKAWLMKDYYIRHGGDRTRIKVKYRTARPRDYYSRLDQAFYRIQAWRLPAAMMARWIMLHGVRVGPFVFEMHDPKRKWWAMKGVNAADLLHDAVVRQRPPNHGNPPRFTRHPIPHPHPSQRGGYSGKFMRRRRDGKRRLERTQNNVD